MGWKFPPAYGKGDHIIDKKIAKIDNKIAKLVEIKAVYEEKRAGQKKEEKPVEG